MYLIWVQTICKGFQQMTLEMAKFCCLLITFANSLATDQDWQNVCPVIWILTVWNFDIISVVVLEQDTFILAYVVLVKPRKTGPCLTERLLMGRKESNQTNKQII